MERRNFALTLEQKEDARRALRLLAGKNLSLEMCVRLALQLPDGQSSEITGRPLPAAIGEFIERVRARGRRPKTVLYYDEILATFDKRLAGLSTTDLSSEVCRQWLESTKSPGGRLARWRALRSFLRWCETAGYCGPHVVKELSRWASNIDVPVTEPGFLSPEECKRILGRLRVDLIPSAALGLFAGLRPYEICRLDWSALNTDEKFIRVSAEVSKTRRGRIIENLPETLWAWLSTPGEGKVCPLRPVDFTSACKRAAGVKKWPHDGLRHTFATYHVAAFNDPGRTAMLLGHEGSPTLLHRHYRGLARAADGVQFWDLRPE